MPEVIGPKELTIKLRENLREYSLEEFQRIMGSVISVTAGKYVSAKHFLKCERNQMVRTLFNGSNYCELSEQFRLSRRQIQRIVDKK